MTPKPPPPKVTLDHVTQVRMTVHDAIEELREALPRLGRATFRQLTSKYTHRLEVIVHFLGLLELYKEGVVDLEQALTFGDLKVEWTGNDGNDVLVDLRERVLVDAYDG